MTDILLLVQKCAHTFSFYDLETKTALRHIVLPNFPHEFTVDATQRFAYVGIFGIETAWTRGQDGDHRIAEIDLHERKFTRMLDLWPYYRPHGMASDSAGRLYAMSEANDMLLVFDRPREQDVPNMAVPSGGVKTHLVTLTRDARCAYGVHLLSNTITQFHPRDATVAPRAAASSIARPDPHATSSNRSPAPTSRWWCIATYSRQAPGSSRVANSTARRPQPSSTVSHCSVPVMAPQISP